MIIPAAEEDKNDERNTSKDEEENSKKNFPRIISRRFQNFPLSGMLRRFRPVIRYF